MNSCFIHQLAQLLLAEDEDAVDADYEVVDEEPDFEGMSPTDEKVFAQVSHLAPLIGYLVGFGHILIPLLVLIFKGDESDFVREHAVESLNFQISVTIYLIVSIILLIVNRSGSLAIGGPTSVVCLASR